jgi:PAS domain S-box-containing protein
MFIYKKLQKRKEMRQVERKESLANSYEEVPVFQKDTSASSCVTASSSEKIPSDVIKDGLYKYIIHNSIESFFVTDMKGKYLDVNDAFCKMSGYSRQELLTMGIYDLDVYYTNTPEGRKAIEDGFLNMKETGRRHNKLIEVQHKRKDGKIIDISVVMEYMDIMGGVIFHFNKDTTEQKKMLRQLKESEERYRALIELGGSIGEAVVMLQDTSKSEAMHVFVSNEWCNITGYTRDELLVMSFFDILHPRYHKSSLRRHRRKISGASISASFELSIVRKDGAEIPIEIISGYTTYQGRKANVVYIRDITERKRAEEALKESEERYRALFETAVEGIILADLETKKCMYNNPAACAMFGYSNEELIGLSMAILIPKESLEYVMSEFEAQARGEKNLSPELPCLRKDGTVFYANISGAHVIINGRSCLAGFFNDITIYKHMEEEREKLVKLESIGMLAGGIAHDFNNLLTGIMGNISLAKRYNEYGETNETAEILLEAERASLRAKGLTQQLLTFAKGGAPVKKLASIKNVIEDAAIFAMRGSNCKLDFSFSEDLDPVEIDQGQIGQVIGNLVINSSHAMPKGGTIHIRAKNIMLKEEDLLPLPSGRYIQVSVEDQGAGIAEKNMKRMFEPYFTTKQKGSGLGLATSYSIIKNHGGYITVKSKLGVGTIFTFYLPASQEQLPPMEKAVKDVAIRGSGRILVMEDEEVIGILLKRMLTNSGYSVELITNGEETIQKYSEAMETGKPFAGVILDLTVPGGIGGKEVIEKLLEIDPKVKAIVSSGYANDPIMADFKKYGFSGVVTKPYDVRQMQETLHDVLAEK